MPLATVVEPIRNRTETIIEPGPAAETASFIIPVNSETDLRQEASIDIFEYTERMDYLK